MHCRELDPDLLAAVDALAEAGNFPDGKISFYTQPSNSPDLNILDLGLFNALQPAYYGCSPTTNLELIDCVEKTYAEFPSNIINRMWVTLQSVFDSIIVHHGDNNYSMPHMNKEFMEREGICLFQKVLLQILRMMMIKMITSGPSVYSTMVFI